MDLKCKRTLNIIFLMVSVTLCCSLFIGCKKGGKSQDDYINDLYSKDPAVRKAAAEVLGETMSPVGYMTLRDLIPEEEDPDVAKAMLKAYEAIEKKRGALK